MTTTDEIRVLITSLRAVAKAAPPGPWQAAESSGYANPSVRNADGPLFATGNSKKRTRQERRAACRYVATASPSMMLDLLEILEHVLSERDALVAAIDRFAVQVGIE